MKIERYTPAPQQAIDVRIEVFVKEQGFRDEFDAIDEVAVHFVAFDEKQRPIGTCRIFTVDNPQIYLLGRLAVVKDYRQKGLGSKIVEEAEDYVRSVGAKEIRLHAQCRVAEFYEKIGYVSFGEIEEEEGCPHIWMKKAL